MTDPSAQQFLSDSLLVIAHVLSPIFLLAFHGLVILSKPKASRVRAVLCCCNIRGDALEFSHVSPTVSDEILGAMDEILQSIFLLTKKQSTSMYTVCSTAD